MNFAPVPWGFPGVPMIDLSGALAERFSELAVDGADGIVAQFEVELALREIGVGMAHGVSSRVADQGSAG